MIVSSAALGRQCLRQLVKIGIKCSYVLINAVSYIMKEVWLCVHVAMVTTAHINNYMVVPKYVNYQRLAST